MTKKEKLVRKILMEQYESYYRLAFAYAHNETDAMDIVQEGAYKAMLKADTLREENFAGTWIYRIMINEAKDYLRKRPKVYAVPEESQETVQDQYGDMDLKTAVDGLPEQEKTLIILRFYEDKQLSEIADILAENLSTVKSRLYRTLKKLREELEKK